MARRHAIRFVEQNSTLASQVRDDVSALARSTFTTLTKAPVKKARKTAAAASARARAAPESQLTVPPLRVYSRLATPGAPRSRGALFFCMSSQAVSADFNSRPPYGSPLYSVVSSGQQTFQES